MENRKLTKADEREILLKANAEAKKTIDRAPHLQRFAYQDPIFFGKNYIDLPERMDLEWQRQDGGHY